MELHVDYLWNVLPIVGTGMLGVFLVTGVIIAGVSLGLSDERSAHRGHGNAGRFPGYRRDHRRCEPAERAHFQRKIMTGVRHSPAPLRVIS